MWLMFRAMMAIAVLACISASATFAFEFGWMRGVAEVYRWTYALAGVALDLLKSGLPILGATAWYDRKFAPSFACWVVFAVLTGLSLWCAYGTTATQVAEKFANQAVAQSDLSTRQVTLDRLRRAARCPQVHRDLRGSRQNGGGNRCHCSRAGPLSRSRGATSARATTA